MIRVILILLAASLTGCAKAEVNPEFAKYLDIYMKEASDRGHTVGVPITYRGVSDLTVRFTDTKIKDTYPSMSEKSVAACIPSYNAILVYKPYWDSLGDTSREILMLHEMGHCILKRKHDDVYGNRNESLMYSQLMYPEVYLRYREYYLDELFNGSNVFEEKK